MVAGDLVNTVARVQAAAECLLASRAPIKPREGEGRSRCRGGVCPRRETGCSLCDAQ